MFWSGNMFVDCVAFSNNKWIQIKVSGFIYHEGPIFLCDQDRFKHMQNRFQILWIHTVTVIFGNSAPWKIP